MKLTKGIISREEAFKVSPIYVVFSEGNFDKFSTVLTSFNKLKRGQSVVTFHDGKFLKAKVSSVDNRSFQADGPVVRVSNGEYSWRVDGSSYAFPIK